MKSTLIAGVSAVALTVAGLTASNAQETAVPSTPPASTTMSKETQATMPVGSYATAQSPSEWRSSKVVGLNVYNSKNEKIGDVNDLIIDANGGVSHAVVGVGGFLGIGEKNVAIPFASMKMARDKDGKATAMVDTTKEALTSAPAFKFYTSS